MKFITIREFRTKIGAVCGDLQDEVVLTRNGRPIAILSRTNPDRVEDDVTAIRRARARQAISEIQDWAKAKGLDKLTMKEIDGIIAGVRRGAKTPK